MKILKMKFGESGDNVDAHGIRFFGDFENEAYRLSQISEMISSNDIAPPTEQKKLTLWFIFKRILPYKSVAGLLDMLILRLQSEGYTIVVSFVEHLADTTSPEYKYRSENKFPTSDRMHGYNAAGGFSVTAEKKGAGTQFSVEEIESMQKLAMDHAQIVYGHTLKTVNRKS
jgi:hypothetical protein